MPTSLRVSSPASRLSGIDRVLRAALLSPFVGQKLMGLMSVERGGLRGLRELIEAGKVRPVIDKTYPLGEAAEAIRYVEDRKSRGKVVITI